MKVKDLSKDETIALLKRKLEMSRKANLILKTKVKTLEEKIKNRKYNYEAR